MTNKILQEVRIIEKETIPAERTGYCVTVELNLNLSDTSLNVESLHQRSAVSG